MLNATHFELGTTAPTFQTSSAAVHDRKQPQLRTPAAGVRPGVGPSEVDRGFREPINSRDYNIVNTGEKLGGALNTETAREARTAYGHKQHPAIPPALRGPSGTRQSFDIITGLDRPRERW